MKKILIIVALLLVANLQLGAIPAYRGLVPYTLPDGSVIQIRMHGDEFFNWVTDASGRVIELGEDGYYYPVSQYTLQSRRRIGAQRRAAVNAARAARAQSGEAPIAIGQKHFLVILVEFKDIHFTYSASDFSNMLNQNGYNVNGGTGSARDFYYENSGGLFEPIFDVYGPVRLNYNRSHYGADQNGIRGNDACPEDAVKEGCKGLDEEIDFTKYDNDGNGDVDLVFMYYAGQGQADGGPDECIWPHQWSIPGGITLDGKYISNYACTNEIVTAGSLKGKLCGIGTACHEFGHAMGLPDFYDTDYDDNGEAGGLYDFSTMCGGAYNNDGRTPPYFNIEERIMLGWLDPSSALQEITQSGQFTLQPVENNLAYTASCDMDGEYFIFEARGAQGWDAPLPGGLLIYHVDKSERSVKILDGNGRSKSVTASQLWSEWTTYNAINENGSHPCFYIIPAKKQSSLNYTGYMKDIIFPSGSGNYTSYQPVDWDGIETAVQISSIAYSSNKVTFNATVNNSKGVSGTVTDTSGNPLQGVTIKVAASGQASTSSNGRVRIISTRDATQGAQYSTQTDAQGHYEIDLQDCTATSVEVSATLEGYVDAAKSVTLKPKGNVVDFRLRKVSESQPSALSKYNTSATDAFGMGSSGVDLMASVYFSEQELAPYAGNLIQKVSFLPTCDAADALYIIIDFGSTRKLTYRVPNPSFDGNMMTVDLEDKNLHIPASSPVYFGYGVDVSGSDCYTLGCVTSASGFNGSYYGRLDLTSSSWYQLKNSEDYFDLIYEVTVIDDGTTPEEEEDPISAAGFSYISVPKDFSFTSGAVFPLELIVGKNTNPSAIVWSIDGRSITGESITLTSGDHTLRATLYYSDGSDETIELEMEVL